MDNRKVNSLMGFAARSGNLRTGYNTALLMIPKRQAKLVMIAEDVGENTKEKIRTKCESFGVKYVEYGTCDELSHLTGKFDKGVFIIADSGFADSIWNALHSQPK